MYVAVFPVMNTLDAMHWARPHALHARDPPVASEAFARNLRHFLSVFDVQLVTLTSDLFSGKPAHQLFLPWERI